jgi:hypothetical protein
VASCSPACWFVYYRSDRVVSHGYLPLLNRPAHIVHFFRDVHGIYPTTKHAWRRARGQRWIEAFARNHRVPSSGQKDMKKKGMWQKDYSCPRPSHGTLQTLRRLLHLKSHVARCSYIPDRCI